MDTGGRRPHGFRLLATPRRWVIILPSGNRDKWGVAKVFCQRNILAERPPRHCPLRVSGWAQPLIGWELWRAAYCVRNSCLGQECVSRGCPRRHLSVVLTKLCLSCWRSFVVCLARWRKTGGTMCVRRMVDASYSADVKWAGDRASTIWWTLALPMT